MTWLQSIILGLVEGVTEFLPVSSTGHLTIAEKLMHMSIDDKGVTAYTAIIQVGAMIAAIIYFWKDIVRIVVGWFKGLTNKEARGADYNMGWAVIAGTFVTGVVGLLGKDLITGPLRSMWVVAGALIIWSLALLWGDRVDATTPKRSKMTLDQVNWKHGLILGAMQCLALIPGVSRSGATIVGGLGVAKLDRVAATKLSFFLGIPALCAAGLFEAASAAKDISSTVGWGPTAVGTVVSFVVAYASIAWLLKFVASNNFKSFVIYRIIAGLAVIGLLVAGVITAN